MLGTRRVLILGFIAVLSIYGCSGSTEVVSSGGGASRDNRSNGQGSTGANQNGINQPTNSITNQLGQGGQGQILNQQAITPNTSGGNGGKTGDFEETYTSANGLSSKYHINVPSDIGPAKAYGLLVYLHGDGGNDYTWFYEANHQIASQHNLIGMTVLSPNNGEAWYDNGSAQAAFLDDLLQKEIISKYNIDKNRVFFAGASGGSQFLTGLFIPVYGLHYQGGSVQMCGGGTNWTEGFNSTPEFIKGFKLYFYTQTSDFLYSQVVEAIDYYTSKGLTIKKELPSGGSHCGFSLDEVLPKALAEIIN